VIFKLCRARLERPFETVAVGTAVSNGGSYSSANKQLPFQMTVAAWDPQALGNRWILTVVAPTAGRAYDDDCHLKWRDLYSFDKFCDILSNL
jgi:hypothetical protein